MDQIEKYIQSQYKRAGMTYIQFSDHFDIYKVILGRQYKIYDTIEKTNTLILDGLIWKTPTRKTLFFCSMSIDTANVIVRIEDAGQHLNLYINDQFIRALHKHLEFEFSTIDDGTKWMEFGE